MVGTFSWFSSYGVTRLTANLRSIDTGTDKEGISGTSSRKSQHFVYTGQTFAIETGHEFKILPWIQLGEIRFANCTT